MGVFGRVNQLGASMECLTPQQLRDRAAVARNKADKVQRAVDGRVRMLLDEANTQKRELLDEAQACDERAAQLEAEVRK